MVSIAVSKMWLYRRPSQTNLRIDSVLDHLIVTTTKTKNPNKRILNHRTNPIEKQIQSKTNNTAMEKTRREGVQEEKRRRRGDKSRMKPLFLLFVLLLFTLRSWRRSPAKKENTAKFQFQPNTPGDNTLCRGLCMFY